MVKNPNKLKAFELELELKTNHTLCEKPVIFNRMYELQKKVIIDRGPFDGHIEKIEISKMLHSAGKTH